MNMKMMRKKKQTCKISRIDTRLVSETDVSKVWLCVAGGTVIDDATLGEDHEVVDEGEDFDDDLDIDSDVPF